ncbi:hypothetical protein MSIMFB_01244 [Mycobacterium simulans]|uniref:Uncharacterized protein n=2 Tax=Mycobacterium simulans TaxID=627089 RepID=A0A7Z7N8I0_9MYCO|nr:hypothetical protein MSIMFB_01244 [Mycobacterium simulans]
MERLFQLVGIQDQPLGDLRALARRGEARIAELSEQLSRSQAELETRKNLKTNAKGNDGPAIELIDR